MTELLREVDLERVRETYLEDLEILMTDLKKEREKCVRNRERNKHISRKILLNRLETLAIDLEDGVELSEQQERDHVKALADETQGCIKCFGAISPVLHLPSPVLQPVLQT